MDCRQREENSAPIVIKNKIISTISVAYSLIDLLEKVDKSELECPHLRLELLELFKKARLSANELSTDPYSIRNKEEDIFTHSPQNLHVHNIKIQEPPSPKNDCLDLNLLLDEKDERENERSIRYCGTPTINLRNNCDTQSFQSRDDAQIEDFLGLSNDSLLETPTRKLSFQGPPNTALKHDTSKSDMHWKRRRSRSNERFATENNTRAKRGKYKMFSESRKTEITLLAKKIGVRQAAKASDIDLKRLRRWIKHGIKRKPGGGRKPLYPELEEKIIDRICETARKTNKIMNRNDIRQLSSKLSTDPEFKASKGWLDKFICRHKDVFSKLKEGTMDNNI